MAACRLHVFLPDDRDETGAEKLEQLSDEFEATFLSCPDAAVQETSPELVSGVFEETPENVERIDAFEATCRDVFPDADILRTRQDRDVMDGQASEHGYEVAIMLTVTSALV